MNGNGHAWVAKESRMNAEKKSTISNTSKQIKEDKKTSDLHTYVYDRDAWFCDGWHPLGSSRWQAVRLQRTSLAQVC